MHNTLFYTAGSSAALSYAKTFLQNWGFSFTEELSSDVTHLLLPVPSFDNDGRIRGGDSLSQILDRLSASIVVIGGNLDCDELLRYRKIDLLKDPFYLASNAAITAHCALKILLQKLPICLENANILIIGWGRIGKCLAAMLRSLGARVTISARKIADRAMLEALGYESDIVPPFPDRYRAVFNTAPETVLPETEANQFPKDCLMIDLASKQGIYREDVLIARGLPGKDAPESSGRLIASCIANNIYNKE